jgi:hypothetical protein
MPTTSEPIFVRIKPNALLKPRARRNWRRYRIFGLEFREERGWYRIPRTSEATVSG